MMGAGLGQLALWLHLRGRRGDGPALPVIPAGADAALVIHTSADASRAEPQILRLLMQSRPDLRMVHLSADDAPDPGDDPVLVTQVLERTRPHAVLLLGTDLPPALIAAADDRRIPLILAEFRLTPADLAWGLRARMRRHLLSRIGAIMMTDAISIRLARKCGLRDRHVSMTGPVSEIREPLQCSETERASMAQQMNGRHAWFASCLPQSEESAILSAHQEALRRAHRALLIIAPCDPSRIDGLARDIEARGLTVARRSEDEDFGDEIQVLLTDGPTEMGLWYRLAPVSFMGGTLSGDTDAMRHPFEPAALGSAIVHGPEWGPFGTEWQHLAGAHATRQVRTPDDLAQAVTELIQPETIATLASNAWMVSTGGAEVAIRITERVLAAMDHAERQTT